MALVVESYSSGTSTTKTVVVTKPTGVSVGDLLLIIAPSNGGGSLSSPGFSAAYSATYDAPGGISDTTVHVLYKIADSADVSASNYSVTYVDAVGAIAAMLRISGWVSGNPVYQSSYAGTYSSANGSVSSTGLTLARDTQQIALMIGASYDGSNSDYYKNESNRTITSSDSNPSWTEICNLGPVTNNVNGVSALTLNVAYASTSFSSTVTGFSFTYEEFDADDTGSIIGVLLLLNTPINTTGSNSLLSVSPTVFTNVSVTVGGQGTNALLAVSPNLPSQSGEALQPTHWTTITKS